MQAQRHPLPRFLQKIKEKRSDDLSIRIFNKEPASFIFTFCGACFRSSMRPATFCVGTNSLTLPTALLTYKTISTKRMGEMGSYI